jgi:hypothetical protein
MKKLKQNVFFSVFLAAPSVKVITSRGDFGLRWQSAAATLLFDCGHSIHSGVALRFPPQSRLFRERFRRAMFFRSQQK